VRYEPKALTADDLNVSPFTRQGQERGYMALCELSEGDTRSRFWRDLDIYEINRVQAREAVETVDDVNMTISSHEKQNKVLIAFRLRPRSL
jgi:hypothetical protein